MAPQKHTNNSKQKNLNGENKTKCFHKRRAVNNTQSYTVSVRDRRGAWCESCSFFGKWLEIPFYVCYIHFVHPAVIHDITVGGKYPSLHHSPLQKLRIFPRLVPYTIP
jgi:hypothetical protein